MKNKEKFIVSIEKDSDGSYIAYNIGTVVKRIKLYNELIANVI